MNHQLIVSSPAQANKIASEPLRLSGAALQYPRHDGRAGAGARAGPGEGLHLTGADGLAAGTAADGRGEPVPAAFMLPTAILLGVTGVSRAGALVLDIQSGYLDRLLLTPVRRVAILIGHMLADVAIACMLMVPILALAVGLGVRLESGPAGVAAFLLMGCAWSLAFAGFGYAIALKTGNPAAVNSSFLLFFPFLFMTSSYVPRAELSGWLASIATWNPVTYILEGLRSLVTRGWQWDTLARAALAIAAVGLVSMSLCLAARRGRTRRG
jgi:ABC-2 type transport system permease protein